MTPLSAHDGNLKSGGHPAAPSASDTASAPLPSLAYAGSDTAAAAAPPTPIAERAAALRRLGDETFDLLVIGGGINGAGIARDAALRGLRVALVERDDFAAGTSSRSSRLVHGGVRYLEHGYLGLVFESSRERRALLRIAPHLVRPLAFTWPVYAGARVPRWKLAAGLLLYDALALFRNIANHRRLSVRGVREREPALASEVGGRALRGGARYHDAATDDSRLTLANAIAAREAGAIVVNHVEATSLVRQDARVAGARVRDLAGGIESLVRARVVVNAAGPWSDQVRRLDDASARDAVRGTKGVHVLVPRDRIGNRDALTLIAPRDGRVVFVLPAGAHAIVGTTDTATDADPAEVRATRADVRYLLEVANAHFPAARLEEGDVVSAWAGIRPLAAGGSAADPSASSREHALVQSASGLLSITGGKLTTYRAMSAEVVDAVERRLGRARSRSRTGRLPLPGGDIASLDDVARDAQRTTGDAESGRHLAESHGTRWRDVAALASADASLAGRVVPRLPVLRATIAYAARRELALTLADVLIRRTKLAFECGTAELEEAIGVTAGVLARSLGWTESERATAIAAYRRSHEQMFRVD